MYVIPVGNIQNLNFRREREKEKNDTNLFKLVFNPIAVAHKYLYKQNAAIFFFSLASNHLFLDLLKIGQF